VCVCVWVCLYSVCEPMEQSNKLHGASNCVSLDFKRMKQDFSISLTRIRERIAKKIII
jgi:hypothetical protein